MHSIPHFRSKAMVCFAVNTSNPAFKSQCEAQRGSRICYSPPVKLARVGTEHELLADSSAPGWSTPDRQQSILLF